MNAVLAGGTRDLDVPTLAAASVRVHDRLLDVHDGIATFGSSLDTTLADAEANANRFRAAVDAYIDVNGWGARGWAAPLEPAQPRATVEEAPRQLDLVSAGITTVIWATGFRRDYSWLDAPVLDADGEPEHERGIIVAPGLYFLGLRWQSRRSSSVLNGVAADAEHVTEHLAARAELPAAA